MIRPIQVLPWVSQYYVVGSELSIFLTDDMHKIGPIIKKFPVETHNRESYQDIFFSDMLFRPQDVIRPFKYAIFADSRYPIWYMNFGNLMPSGVDVLLTDHNDHASVLLRH